MQSMSDIGWVVGHSYVVYGPLLRGASSVFFEGNTIIPDMGITWELAEKYSSKCVGLSPPRLRYLKKLDYYGDFMKMHDLSKLKSIAIGG